VVALATIGGLAHFGVLHHIGTLSQTTIQYAAFGGAGGLLFIEIAQRIVRRLCRKPEVLIDLHKIELRDYNYSKTHMKQEYSVKGQYMEYLGEFVDSAIKGVIERSQQGYVFIHRGIPQELDSIFSSHRESGTISVTKGDYRFTGIYTDGLRLRYTQERPPLTISGNFFLPIDAQEIAQQLSEVDQTEEEILRVLDAYFKQYYTQESTIKVEYDDGMSVTASYDLLGKRKEE